MTWSGDAALAFVRRAQGEPSGTRWQLRGQGPAFASPSGEVRVTAPATILEWGTVSPGVGSGSHSRPKFWAKTTPWNGRGAGEPPGFEYSVELVRLPTEAKP